MLSYSFSLLQNENDFNKLFMSAQPGTVLSSTQWIRKTCCIRNKFVSPFEENVVNITKNKMCDYDLTCMQSKL